MKRTIQYILYCVLCLLTTSCFQEVDLSELRPEPKLVLNCLVQPNEPVKATLTRTWFYQEQTKDIAVTDADVKLYVNDQLQETLSWELNEDSYFTIANYCSDYIPQEGDKIRIEAYKEGFHNTVVGEEVIFKKPQLKAFEVYEDSIRYNNGSLMNYRYHVTFQDNADEVNYYMIGIQLGTPKYDLLDKKPVYQGYYVWNDISFLDYKSDPLFANQLSVLDHVTNNDLFLGDVQPFSDEMINGREYTIHIASSYYYGYYYGDYGGSYSEPTEVQLPDSAKVYLYAISPDYYNYLIGLNAINDSRFEYHLAHVGLAEPIRVWSNIEGGTGILGTACVDSLTIAVPR